jgi:hypothetical protein
MQLLRASCLSCSLTKSPPCAGIVPRIDGLRRVASSICSMVCSPIVLSCVPVCMCRCCCTRVVLPRSRVPVHCLPPLSLQRTSTWRRASLVFGTGRGGRCCRNGMWATMEPRGASSASRDQLRGRPRTRGITSCHGIIRGWQRGRARPHFGGLGSPGHPGCTV